MQGRQAGRLMIDCMLMGDSGLNERLIRFGISYSIGKKVALRFCDTSNQISRKNLSCRLNRDQPNRSKSVLVLRPLIDWPSQITTDVVLSFPDMVGESSRSQEEDFCLRPDVHIPFNASNVMFITLALKPCQAKHATRRKRRYVRLLSMNVSFSLSLVHC